MLDRLGTNPTQLVGVIAFGGATIACLFATFRRDARDGGVWFVIALINSVFLLEILMGFRHRIHDVGSSILMADGTYGNRGPLQEIVIFLLAATAVVVATIILTQCRFATTSGRLAASVSIAVLALFAIEAVSLHALDAVFYRPIGPILLIGWIWLVACAVTTITTLQR
jgi:hypothetical protein